MVGAVGIEPTTFAKIIARVKSVYPRWPNKLAFREGRTALMYAAARQSPEIVDALLRSDARVNEQNSSGQTALHFAASPASPIWDAFNQVADYPEPPTTSSGLIHLFRQNRIPRS